MFAQGQQEDLNEVFSVVYEELKRIAAAVRRSQPGASLNTTALVHEAWLKLQKADGLRYESHGHLKAITARAMRQILLDNARRSMAGKRGGAGETILVSLDEATVSQPAPEVDLIALEMALCRLAGMNQRQADVVQCRFYGSMTVGETAEALGISEASAERDWRFARAWLATELRSRRQGVQSDG